MRRRAGRAVPVAALVLLALALSGPPRALWAQAHPLQLVPFGGVALPQGRIYQYKLASVSHQSRAVFGGRLDAWMNGSLGLEIAAAYAPSGYHVVDSLGTPHDTTGGLFTATARVLYRFVRAGPFRAHLMAGGGVVTHSGLLIERFSGKTNPAGVVGLSAGVAVSRWTLQVTAEQYLYAAGLGAIPGYPNISSRPNGVFVLSLGAEIPLGAWLPNDLRRLR